MKINLTLPIKVENRENPIITMPKTSGVKVVKQGDLEITLVSVFKKKKMEQPKEEVNQPNIAVGSKVRTKKRGKKEEVEGHVKKVSYIKRAKKYYCLIEEVGSSNLFWKEATKVTLAE